MNTNNKLTGKDVTTVLMSKQIEFVEWDGYRVVLTFFDGSEALFSIGPEPGGGLFSSSIHLSYDGNGMYEENE